MFCKFCGKPIDAAQAECPACGKPQHAPDIPPAGLRRGQFYKKHFRCRRSLRAAGILCYVGALLTFVLGMMSGLGIWSLIDMAILLFFGGVMHLFRSRAAAIALCAYAVFCLLTVFIHGFAGIFALLIALLAVIAAILGVRGTFCFARDWKAYCVACGKVH